MPIPHAGGEHPPKPLFPIIAGLVATKAQWHDGLGVPFLKNHATLLGDRKLDCVLALQQQSFDTFSNDATSAFSPESCSLAFFLFRLLQKLQSLGTVPAVDWNAYAAQLAGK